MPSPTTLGRGRKTACEVCRARKRKCDCATRVACRVLCHKVQLRCIYASQSPYAPGSRVMFPSVPRDVDYVRTEDSSSASQVGISTPMDYDLSHYLNGNMDFRQHFNGVNSPMTPAFSGSSETSSNLNVTSSQHEQNIVGAMHSVSTQLLDIPLPEIDMGILNSELSSEAMFSTTNDWQQHLSIPSDIAALPSESVQLQLPSQERVSEMVNSFFSAQHQLLPTVHKESFMARLSNDMIDMSSGPFLWVVLALYCSCDKSEPMQVQYRSWMQIAHSKLEFVSTTHERTSTTNMLQASIWMIVDAYCRGDITNAWLLLGRAAQLTSALGPDRIDSKYRTQRMESELSSCSDIEMEERRKCMWSLALLDRVIVSVNGLALSVDDRYFHVDFPLPDQEFQEAQNSIKDIEHLRESYTSEAFDLLNRNATSAMATKPSFEHILKVSVILGRALAIQNSIRHDDGSTNEQHLEKLRTLESVLNTFCYAASASDKGVGLTPLMQLWLKMFTQCSKISMLHPPGPSTLGLCNCLDVTSDRTNTECVRAAMNAASTFSHALQEETLLALLNPFLLPMACTSVRMLTLLRRQMHESDRDRVRGLIDEILRVIDHIAIKFPGAAAKARETIIQRVNELEHGMRGRSSNCYIGMDC